MRLYSVQPLCVWNELAQGNTVTARPTPDDDDGFDDTWFSAYRWLAAQMRSRSVASLNNEPPPEYPMWAWYWYNGHRKTKPDLRHSMMRNWAKEKRMVLLTLDVDAARVQLSDYDGWHWCLNYWYLDAERKADAFTRETQKAIETSFYATKPLPSPYHEKVQDSWCRIFDLDTMRKLLHAPKKRQVVQATLWQLTQADVVCAVEFGLGKPARSIDFSTHPHLPS